MWRDEFDRGHRPEVRQWEVLDGVDWEARVKAFLATPDDPNRFNWPFPMGVFGTLRSKQGNNPLMHRGEVKKVRPAFLAHFYARGLSIGFTQDSCAPFEVFEYTPEEWVKMIGQVDCLESFSPGRSKHENGYYRTLAWLRLMPEGHVCKWFPADRRADLWDNRNMALNPETWGEYDRIPAWIYSSLRQNREAAKVENSPIIWPCK